MTGRSEVKDYVRGSGRVGVGDFVMSVHRSHFFLRMCPAGL